MCIITTNYGKAQDYAVKDIEILTRKDGLIHNIINTELSDHKGFLWVGTDNGLCKYDGYNFIIYNSDTTKTNFLNHNKINTLFIDKFNILWIGTEKGLNCFDISSGNILNPEKNIDNNLQLLNKPVYTINQDKFGNIWIGAKNGLFQLTINNQTNFKNFLKRNNSHSANSMPVIIKKLSNESVTVLLPVNNTLWIGYRSNKVAKYNILTHVNTSFFIKDTISIQNAMAMHTDKQGYLWIGTWGEGLYRINLNSEKCDKFYYSDNEKTFVDTKSCIAIQSDNWGNIWFANSDKGLFRLLAQNNNADARNIIFENYEKLHPLFSRTEKQINSLHFAPSGVLWAGTNGGGLLKIMLIKNDILHFFYSKENRQGISASAVHNVYEDKDKNLWFSLYNGGINILTKSEIDNKTYRFKKIDSENNSADVMKIFSNDNKNIWATYFDVGLRKINYNTKKSEYYNISVAYGAAFQQNNYLWLGNYNSVRRFNLQTNSFDTEISSNYVSDIAIDSNNTLWVATISGLDKITYDSLSKSFQKKSFRIPEINGATESSNYINKIYIDSKNQFWLCTRNGLFIFDPVKFEVLKMFDIRNGFNNANFKAITEDYKQNYWIVNQTGITKLNPKTGTIENYELTTFPFSITSLSDNKLCVCSKNGIHLFHPDSIKPYSFKANISFTKLFVNGLEVKIGETINNDIILSKDISETTEITLNWKNSRFEIQFSALSFFNQQFNQFKYKLSGADTNWINRDSRSNSLMFNNL